MDKGCQCGKRGSVRQGIEKLAESKENLLNISTKEFKQILSIVVAYNQTVLNIKSIVEKQWHLLQFNSKFKKMQIGNSTSVTTSIAKLKTKNKKWGTSNICFNNYRRSIKASSAIESDKYFTSSGQNFNTNTKFILFTLIEQLKNRTNVQK